MINQFSLNFLKGVTDENTYNFWSYLPDVCFGHPFNCGWKWRAKKIL
jgi:hypothetical protein